MMKVAVIKLGSRISISSNDSSGGTGETLAIINILITAGIEVDAFTKVLSKDKKPDNFRIFDLIENIDNINKVGYEALIVLNGNVNYFGGVDDPYQTLNYKVINTFKGKVFYIHCDGNLYLKQIWPSIEKKSWKGNYKEKDINIVRNDIIYITQSKNTNLVLEKANKCGVTINTAIYFPLEKFPFISDPNIIEFNENPKYDLLYGGTFRNGRREEDMIKFYFGYDKFNVTMFGKIDSTNFTKNKENLSYPNFEKSVDYKNFKNKMNESIATVIIGDKIYKKQNDLAQRIYECVLSNTVVLIDSSYDYEKRVFKDPFLQEFCYVDSREDVEHRLSLLKDNDFRKTILNKQIEDTKIDRFNYCRDFVNIIKTKIVYI